MRRTELWVMIAAAPLLWLAGCAEGAEEAEEVVEDGPRVEIVEPAEGSTVAGTDIRVALETHGAQVEPADARQTPGRGHHHIFIDESPSPPGAPIPPTSQTVIHMGNGAEEYVIPTLAPGPHRIIAVFAYGDHVPMPDVAQDTVEFTVAAP